MIFKASSNSNHSVILKQQNSEPWHCLFGVLTFKEQAWMSLLSRLVLVWELASKWLSELQL